jgi:haloacetate dehalogenase
MDMRLDETDRQAGRRITCPVQALWGLKNGLERWYDVLSVWRDWASQVEGHGIDCGHYLAEEAPDQTLAALRPFLTRAFNR